jgi:hypothetical protein
LIWVDLVTCARHYNHKKISFHKFIIKDHCSFFSFFFFVTKFPNHDSEHGPMDYYGLKMDLCITWTQLKKVNGLYICIFLVMYHCYQVHCKMLNNTNIHVHVRRKIVLFVDSLPIASHVGNKNLITFINEWELSIFKTMLAYINKLQNISLFENF